ncbi:MAG: hypothetical protein KDD66_17780 [Bdellovibrionales bacterium]|nr:hypothetical protein [Bdellovibrionales bacterium]
MEFYQGKKSEELKHHVCAVLDELGLKYETERYSEVNSAIIGKRRRIDVVVVDDESNPLMHIECKHQRTAGTAEVKLFRAVVESNRDKNLGIPSIIVFSGFGWTPADMRHALLNGSVRIEFFKDWMKLFFSYRKLEPDSICD